LIVARDCDSGPITTALHAQWRRTVSQRKILRQAINVLIFSRKDSTDLKHHDFETPNIIIATEYV
jgi:hypothetical protein